MGRRAGSGNAWGSDCATSSLYVILGIRITACPDRSATRKEDMSPKTSTSREEAVEEVIEILRERIANHGDHIDGHETRGRVMLIDPLLSVLGWDPLDPDRVVHEYPVDNKKLDYVLLDGESRVCVIEAKSLKSKLDNLQPGQLAFFLKHPEFEGLQAVAYTNGDQWHVYRQSNGWVAERLTVSSGQSYKTATEFCRAIGDLKGDGPINGESWFAIDDKANFPEGNAPTAIRIGGGEPTPVNHWYDLLVEVARHLIETGELKRSDVPLQTPRGKKYLVSRSGTEWNGKPFMLPKEVAPGFWVDGLGGVRGIPKKCGRLIRAVGADPLSVKVRFESDGRDLNA